jgi:hypothetical protein
LFFVFYFWETGDFIPPQNIIQQWPTDQALDKKKVTIANKIKWGRISFYSLLTLPHFRVQLCWGHFKVRTNIIIWWTSWNPCIKNLQQFKKSIWTSHRTKSTWQPSKRPTWNPYLSTNYQVLQTIFCPCLSYLASNSWSTLKNEDWIRASPWGCTVSIIIIWCSEFQRTWSITFQQFIAVQVKFYTESVFCMQK